jgi:uroporphyrinogen decarboxylase
MNSKERVTAAVAFEPTDRTPVIAQVFGHAAVLAGVPLRDYVCDGELLAHCQLQALEHYRYDAIFAVMDTCVETEAMGSMLTYRADRYPAVDRYTLTQDAALETLRIPEVTRDGRMPELLKSIRLLRKEVEDTVLVVGCVVGPMTLATQLMGLENALYTAADDPDRFTRILDVAADVVIRFGTAQIDCGAHLPVVFDPSSSPDVIPPAFYREFVVPRLQNVMAAFKQAGALANWLHTAGPVEPILPFYTSIGVDIANFDFCVNPCDAIQALPQTCLDGNIKPLAFVMDSPEMISAQSKELITSFSDRGGFILSSGCEIPPESNPESIAAMVQAVQKRYAI